MMNRVELAQIDLNLLVLFDVVAQERHVGRAASRLGVSASAVSHGLGRLRAMLHDPLFTKTPKGVLPTTRAQELAEPIAEILARVREVVATGQPFDPARSRRRFTLGAPDALAAFVLPQCLAAIRKDAPGIELAVVNLFPNMMLAALDAKQIDLALAPLEEIPPRFASRPLFVEEFVIAARRGHPFFAKPTLARYCAMQHIVVSLTGDPFGLVDIALAEKGLSRSVVLTVPSHVLALSILAETDLLAATPRSLVATQADRYRLASADSPIRLPASPINAVAPVAALRDAGLAWLMDTLERAIRTHAPGTRRRSRAR